MARSNGHGHAIGLGKELSPILVAADTVQPRELEALWPCVLWIGKPCLIAGDPGLGKSLATVDIAARVSRGSPWPCETAERAPGDVLMVSGEDDPEDTIVPRLIAAGADLARITFMNGVKVLNLDTGEHADEILTLEHHLRPLADAIQRRPGTKLLIVDPISAFMGRADTHRNSEVRRILAGLAAIAQKYRVAVLVISHLSKGEGNALKRISGSLAFVAAARSVFCIVKDPEHPLRRLLLPIKSNLGPDTLGFAYSISVADNDAPMVRWEDEKIDKSADEILAKDLTAQEAGVIAASNEVTEWLRNKLTSGPRPAAELWRASKENGYGERAVERAKRSLGVRSEMKGFRGAWHWVLPEDHRRTGA